MDLLAIIISTPFTFLAWGVLTFLVAVISYFFFGFQSTMQGTNVPTLVAANCIDVIVAAAIKKSA